MPENIIQKYEKIYKETSYINEEVKKVCRLVEERGVAAYRYRHVVKQIIDFLQNTVKEISPIETFKVIDVPKEYTSQIDFIYNLDITVNLIKHGNDYNSGSGKSAIDYDAKLINGKINDGYIEIEAYYANGLLDKYTFERTFYHELNHYYDMWQDLLKNNNVNRFYNDALKSSNFHSINIFDNQLDKIIGTILYRLFSDTELNATISGVYGELSSLKSKRENFSQDIQKLIAYKLYNDILYYIKIVNKLNSEQLTKIKLFLQDNGVILHGYGSSIEAFKKEFIGKIRWRLKNLLRGIGKVASLYYDNNERDIKDFTKKIMI